MSNAGFVKGFHVFAHPIIETSLASIVIGLYVGLGSPPRLHFPGKKKKLKNIYIF